MENISVVLLFSSVYKDSLPLVFDLKFVSMGWELKLLDVIVSGGLSRP